MGRQHPPGEREPPRPQAGEGAGPRRGLIAAFEEEEGPIPEWMARSIRETDIEHAIGFIESWPTWDGTHSAS